MRPKTRWGIKIKSKAAGKRAVIDIYDVITSDGEGVSAKDILEKLNGIDPKAELLIRLNSAGGDVTEGIAIYNLLAAHEGKVTVRIDGLAGSIATVICCAADEVQIAANAFFMIHNPWSQMAGGAEDLREIADHLDTVTDQMIAIYSDRSGLDPKEIRKLCDEETWMTAEEALE